MLADAGDHLVAERCQSRLLSVVLQVQREVADADAREFRQPCDLGLGRSDDAEPLDDLVGHELGVGVARSSVLVVVVSLASGDVVGQAPRHRVTLVPITGHEVRDVVPDHPAEPSGIGRVRARVPRRSRR